MKKLIIYSKTQTADLWDGENLLKTYMISTAEKGLGCEENSFQTPTGLMRVSEKIGDDAPYGTVFKARVPTGALWKTGDYSDEDLILTRILWLEGKESQNSNTKSRYIYLHGTNQENRLGTAASHGCIRFSNQDIVEVFDHLVIGSEVFVM